MKNYLTLIAGALMIAACSNDDATTSEVSQFSGKPIQFEMAEEGVSNTTTRALGEINTDALLQAEKIGVFGFYTGALTYENTTVKPEFMWNQPVAYASSAWDYTPLKYWPNDATEYISFFAYAPYEASPSEDKCITDISANSVAGDPWLNYRLATDPFNIITTADATDGQVDLLFGTKKEGTSAPYTYTPWTDTQRQNLTDKVDFTMKHALACIGNSITIKLSSEMAALIKDYSKIQIEGIEIVYKNLTNKARLVLNSADGSANWKELISGELTTTRTYTNDFATADYITFTGADTDVSTAQEIAYLNQTTGIAGDGLFYIPMQVKGTDKATAEVTLKYRVKILGTGDYLPAAGDPAATVSNTFDLTIDNMAGKKQGIALTLGKDFSLMHEVWVLGGTASEPSYSRIIK